MHETGLIRDLIRKVDQIVATNGASRASEIRVTLGAMAHISAEHFCEHFDEESVGTRCEGARLKITESTDTYSPTAQDILLESIDVEVSSHGAETPRQ